MEEHLKILVVDDEECIRDIFQDYLTSTTNHTVLTANDGLEAFEIIKAEEIDCCFTDLSMPRLDGLELAQRISQHDNTIPVVVMTGYPSMDNAIETLKNGVADFITKPFRMNQILPTINKVMTARSHFVENILLKEEAEKGRKLIKINQELQEKLKEVETINLIFQNLDQATTSQDLFKVLVNLSGRITQCDEAHFCFFNQGMKDYDIITSFFRDQNKKKSDAVHIEKKIAKKVANDGMPFLIRGNNGNRDIIAIPLKIRSSVFGILTSIIGNGAYCFSEKDLYYLNFLVEKASFLIENLALYENIYENLFSTLYAFVETIEARDPYTKQHSANVSKYAMSIANANGCSQDEIAKLNVSGNLHDIGKIGIPDSILLKPGRLTDEEYEIIKKHPVIGSNIIGHFGMWTDEQSIIRHHHERFDGKGYPDGLKGEEIPFLARILSVADVYDALTTDRSYRSKMPDHVAVKIIRENAGSQFDPKIVKIFLKLHNRGEIKV
ncbi:MAG: response regulator [Thermodesulfobacteriota bacterium]|nr:response regulator [Thermodesulfobacteriota bacterium]